MNAEYERHIRVFGGEPCYDCGGTGIVGYYEYGMFFGDDCPACIERGKCPRCGEPVLPDELPDIGVDTCICDSCGFIVGLSPGGAAPPDCICADDERHFPIDDSPPF